MCQVWRGKQRQNRTAVTEADEWHEFLTSGVVKNNKDCMNIEIYKKKSILFAGTKI